MGMVGNLLRVTPQELEEILQDPAILEEMVEEPDEVTASNLLDLDKSWEGVFYLFNGYGLADLEENPPSLLPWILFSGQVIDEDQDLGYGPAHYLTAEQVARLNRELDSLSLEQLSNRYDGEAMNQAGIYPQIWDEEGSRDYVLQHTRKLKEFYAAAEQDAQAVIAFIS